MLVVAVVGGILIVVLACITTYMAVVGGLGALGASRFVRCPRCGHLVTASGSGPPERCAHCRHVALYHHPFQALHDYTLVHGGLLTTPEVAPGTGEQSRSRASHLA
jgi:hypothetical protein